VAPVPPGSGWNAGPNPFGKGNPDGDWSLFIQPNLAWSKYANNSHNVTNGPPNSKGQPAGIVECEIQPKDNSLNMYNELFAPLVNVHNVTVVGAWVEDLSHNSKTELHPITSVLAPTYADSMRCSYKFFAFSDASVTQPPTKPKPVFFQGVSRLATFSVSFPSRPDTSHQPVCQPPVLMAGSSSPALSMSVDQTVDPPVAHGQVWTGTPNTGQGVFAAELSFEWV